MMPLPHRAGCAARLFSPLHLICWAHGGPREQGRTAISHCPSSRQRGRRTAQGGTGAADRCLSHNRHRTVVHHRLPHSTASDVVTRVLAALAGNAFPGTRCWAGGGVAACQGDRTGDADCPPSTTPSTPSTSSTQVPQPAFCHVSRCAAAGLDPALAAICDEWAAGYGWKKRERVAGPYRLLPGASTHRRRGCCRSHGERMGGVGRAEAGRAPCVAALACLR